MCENCKVRLKQIEKKGDNIEMNKRNCEEIFKNDIKCVMNMFKKMQEECYEDMIKDMIVVQTEPENLNTILTSQIFKDINNAKKDINNILHSSGHLVYFNSEDYGYVIKLTSNEQGATYGFRPIPNSLISFIGADENDKYYHCILPNKKEIYYKIYFDALYKSDRVEKIEVEKVPLFILNSINHLEYKKYE